MSVPRMITLHLTLAIRRKARGYGYVCRIAPKGIAFAGERLFPLTMEIPEAIFNVEACRVKVTVPDVPPVECKAWVP